MNIELYIENNKVDLSENIVFPLNKVWENLENPTDYINDFSKTISLPRTKNNDKIFGDIFSLDRISLNDDENNSGVYFNPTKKADFYLLDNGEKLIEGYCKLSVSNDGLDSKSYSINLYGKIGEIFQKMKNITFDEKNNEGEEYVIESPFEFRLNSSTIKESFENDSNNLDIETSNHFTDYCGFFPLAQGLYSNFNSKSYEDNNGNTHNFADAINGSNGTGADSIVGDGLTDRVIKQYRCYYQKPFVYVNKMIQLLKQKIESISEYKILLDGSFFNAVNPYYSKLVYICKGLQVDDKDTFTNQYTNNYDYGNTESFGYGENKGEIFLPLNLVSEQVPILTGATSVIYNQKYKYKIKSTICPKLKFYSTNFSGGSFKCNIVSTANHPPVNREINVIKLVLNIADENGNIIPNTEKKYLIKSFDVGDEIYSTEYTLLNWGDNIKIQSDKNVYYTPVLEYENVVDTLNNVDANKLQIKLSVEWLSSNPYLTESATGKAVDRMPKLLNNSYINSIIASNTNIELITNKRTNRIIKLVDLLGVDFNLFDFFIKYCKIFGLVIHYDEMNKTIKVMTKNKYFENYKIVDWSNKVDKSKEFQITPVNFDSKYIVFNYDSIKDGKYYVDYQDNYSVGYGAKKLNTNYNFNTDSKDLFKGINPTITASESIISLKNLVNHKFKYEWLNEVNVIDYKLNGTKKESINLTNQFAFRNSNKSFNNDDILVITDDTYFQQNSGEYMYIGNSISDIINSNVTGEKIYKYPYIDFVDDSNSYGCLFSQPVEVYKNPLFGEINNNAKFIYPSFWERYIAERYSVDNKKVTGYFYLNNLDFKNFDFNTFIRLGNCLYIVNKIYDFNPNNNDVTKIDLIQIQNIENYTKGQISFSYLYNNCDDYIELKNGNYSVKFYVSDDENTNVSFTLSDWVENFTYTWNNDGYYLCNFTINNYYATNNRDGFIICNGATKTSNLTIHQIATTTYLNLNKSVANFSETTKKITIKYDSSHIITYSIPVILKNYIKVSLRNIKIKNKLEKYIVIEYVNESPITINSNITITNGYNTKNISVYIPQLFKNNLINLDLNTQGGTITTEIATNQKIVLDTSQSENINATITDIEGGKQTITITPTSSFNSTDIVLKNEKGNKIGSVGVNKI